jgi:hypothetical protein
VDTNIFFLQNDQSDNIDMSHELDVSDEPVFGAFAISSAPSHEEFELKEGDVSEDEKLARQLQMEEFESASFEAPPRRSEFTREAASALERQLERHKTNAPEVLRRERDSLQQELKAERDRHTRDQERIRELTEQQAREREERRIHEQNERRANNELARTIKEIGDIAKTRELLRSTYPLEYDRIYNWSLTLLPDYYDIDLRSSLRSALSRLIKRELLLNSSEYELERKIRKTILDAEEAAAANKKLSAAVNAPQFELVKPTPDAKPTKTTKSRKSSKSSKSTKSRKSRKPVVRNKSKQKK